MWSKAWFLLWRKPHKKEGLVYSVSAKCCLDMFWIEDIFLTEKLVIAVLVITIIFALNLCVLWITNNSEMICQSVLCLSAPDCIETFKIWLWCHRKSNKQENTEWYLNWSKFNIFTMLRTTTQEMKRGGLNQLPVVFHFYKTHVFNPKY